jgi:hypothetical protein
MGVFPLKYFETVSFRVKIPILSKKKGYNYHLTLNMERTVMETKRSSFVHTQNLPSDNVILSFKTWQYACEVKKKKKNTNILQCINK